MCQLGIGDLVVTVGIDDEQPLFAFKAAKVFSLRFGVEPAKSRIEPKFTATERGFARLLEFDGPDRVFSDLVAKTAPVLDLLLLEIKIEFLVPGRAAWA